MSPGMISDRVRFFRQDRVRMIATGNTPIPLVSSPKTIFHLVPLSPADGLPTNPNETLSRKIAQFYSSHQYGPGEKGWADREGFLLHTTEWYVRVFATGAIEIVETGLLKTRAREKLVSSPDYELGCFHCLRSHLVAQWSSFFNVDAQPSVAVMITLLGASGFAMDKDSFRGLWTPGSNRIDDDIVELPEVLLDNSGGNLLEKFRPVWDGLWRAAGWEGSPHYDEAGHWAPKWACATV